MYLSLLLRCRRGLDRLIDLATDAARHEAAHVAAPASPPPTPVAAAPAAPAAPAWTGGVRSEVVAGEVSELDVGAEKHRQIVELWLKNWRVEGAPQPDRVNALMSAYSGWLRPWRAYIRDRGGLVQATRDTLVRHHQCAVEDALPLARALAQEMAAVGSTANIPVDGFLESSLFCDPYGPLSGGCVADSAPMDRPRY